MTLPEETARNPFSVGPASETGYDGVSIPVTRTFLPPEAEYLEWVHKAWDRRWLTNNGPIHRTLETRLRSYLGTEQFLLMSNGTLALQLALRGLGVKGRVITTPFSYVATVSAILWEGCEPVFADVDPETLCLDPAGIETCIDDRTTAILATHVYGIPCDVVAIEAIARRHGLVVIYDGAHAFGSRFEGKSLTNYGDACALSFHATKLFHTVEGGGLVLQDQALTEHMRLLRSFGHRNDDHFCLGINAKMSEVHAAMGMAVLPHIEHIISDRARVCARYDEALDGLPVRRPVLPAGTTHNHAYYPILFKDAATRQRVMDTMAEDSIVPRRYFHPSLNTLPYVSPSSMPISEKAAATVLSLPLYVDLSEQDQDRVVAALRKALI